jgi:hypothetical protein
VSGLLADVLFLVVAMALGGVERTAWRAAGALVALVVFGSGFYGFGLGFCHRCLRWAWGETLTAPASFPDIETPQASCLPGVGYPRLRGASREKDVDGRDEARP